MPDNDIPEIRKVVAEYLAKGLSVVPLAPGEKRCKDENWKKIQFDAEDFRDEDNIGIKSINGIIVVDIDSADAVTLADNFLPPTDMIYGRPTKPRAKRIYRCDVGETILAFKDGAEMLVEIRTNHQDMAPPSIHPSGEKVEWVKFGEATDVDPEILKRSVQMLATCALIARNYNPPKQRHHWCMALVGELKKIGLKESETENIVKHAAAYAGDPDVQDRLGTVSSTYNRGDDEAISAGKDLKELTASSADQFVKSLRKIWGQATTSIGKDLLDKLNSKHAVVFQESGSLVVITEDRKDGREFLRFSTFQTIRDLYPTKVQVGITQNGNPVLKGMGAAWLEHPNRNEYRGMELNSKETTEGYYNLWRGFSVEPKKGDWSLYRTHLLEVICAENKEYANWVFQWMAQAVQKPTAHAHTAIALRGGQGVGKSTFAEWFGSLFGGHFLELSSSQQLTGRFNAHLHNAIMVFADEAAWPGDKRGVGTLRRMITQDSLSIERKGFDILTVPNHIHLMIASNSEWIVPAGPDERRFAVFDVADKYKQNTKFFAAVRKQLFEGEGLQALLYDLLECRVNTDLREIPKTKALSDQKQLSSSALDKWWYDLLNEGELFWNKQRDGHDIWIVDKADVYVRYLEDMKDRGVRAERLNKVHFWREINKFAPPPVRPTYRDFRNNKRYYQIASLEASRKWYGKVRGMEIVWDQDEDSEDEVEKMPF